MNATQQPNNFPKLHNAMWPGLVGKGSPGAEPCIDLDTMLDLTAKAEVNGVKFDGVDLFLHDPHVSIDLDDDGIKKLADKAIEQLPDEGEIHFGNMDWRGESPQLLAEGTFLAFSVDLEHAGDQRSPAHVQLEFGRETFRLQSLLGYTEARYPAKWMVAFNRKELKPWWGAWQPAGNRGQTAISRDREIAVRPRLVDPD